MSDNSTLRLDGAPIAELVVTASTEPVIDHSYEARLAELLVEGHCEVRQTLVRCNLRVAIDEAIRHRGLGESQARMVRRGVRALVEAAETYRPAAHGPFSDYVRSAVRSAIRGSAPSN
jgi:DNA-directed RNA polymerase sigma subunit (sigma70/sigma32)